MNNGMGLKDVDALDQTVFLGLGGTVDAEVVCESHGLQQLVDGFDISLADVMAVETVRSPRDLVCWLLNQVRLGRGGEKFVDNPEVITWASDHFPNKTTLGGTDIRAATVLSMHGVRTVAHVAATDETMLRLVPSRCQLITTDHVERLIPHLIMQYAPGLKVRLEGGTVQATKADRVIFANDPPNAKLPFAQGLRKAIANSSVVLLSTLNVIQDREVLRDRLDQLIAMLSERTHSGPVLWEDAGYHDVSNQLLVAQSIGPHVDVFGTNLEELAQILGLTTEPETPGEVREGLVALAKLTGAPNTVVHSSNWAAVWGPNSPQLVEALDYGNAVASTRFALGDDMTLEDIAETRQAGFGDDQVAKERSAFVKVAEGIDPLLRVSQNYPVQAENPTTIGLGDAFLGGVLKVLHDQQVEAGDSA